MKPLAAWLRLPGNERALVCQALAYLVAFRIGLWALPLRVILRRVETVKAKPLRDGAPPAKRIAWAVRAASRYAPGATNCLVQSLAAQTLLTRRGYAAQLRIGVARDDREKFTAHAWVECDGAPIIGGAGAADYTALPPLKAQRDGR